MKRNLRVLEKQNQHYHVSKPTILWLVLFILLSKTTLFATTYTVTTTANTGAGSLRTAITSANADVNVPHTINFNIAAGSTILLSSALPFISRTTILDATTSIGYVANSVGINIDCQNEAHGLRVENAANVEIYGFNIYNATSGIYINGDGADGFKIGAFNKRNFINNSSEYNIYIDGADNGFIRNNYVGTNTAGDAGTDIGNGILLVNSANTNTIGGSVSGEGNLIGGGISTGVNIGSYVGLPASGSSNNIFYGNTFGGTGITINGWAIWIDGDSDNNVIGGILPGQGNNMQNATNGNTANGLGNLVVGINSLDALGNVVRGNNMDCGFGFGIVLNDANASQAAPIITSFIDGLVTGTSTANAIIDIYTGSSCNTVYGKDKPKTYLTSVTANNNGDWIADLTSNSCDASGQRIIASATDLVNGTGAYSDAYGPVVFGNGSGNANLPVIASGPLTLCGNQTINLTAQTGNTGYLWSNGQSGNVLNVTTAGSYFVTAQAASGCILVSDTFLIVQENPTLTVAINGDLEICGNETVDLVAQSGFASYTWSNGFTGSTLTVNSTGGYSVSAVTSGGCSAVSGVFNVTASSVAQANFTYVQLDEYTVQFTSTAVNAISWLWDFGSGNTSTLENPQFDFLYDNNWPVSLIVNNNCGADTFNTLVTVIKTGINDLFETPVQIINAESFIQLNGKIKQPADIQVQVQNLQGQILSSSKHYLNSDWQVNIPTDNLAKGIYFVTLHSQNKKAVYKWLK